MRVSKCVEVDVDFDVDVTDFADDMNAAIRDAADEYTNKNKNGNETNII